MSVKGNQNSATYKKEIVISYIKQYPKASTMALARIIFKENTLDFNSVESVRASVRRYRGESGGKRNSQLTKDLYRDEQTKKQFMRKTIDLPESDYEKCEPFIIPKGQNRILVLSDIHFPYQDNKALELALNYGLEKKANAIYLNGDILDFYQCSRFTKDRRLRDMAGELQMGRDFLKMIQEMFKCPIYYKIGNHEKRYEDYLMIKAPELLGIDDFKLEQLLRFREFGVTLVKDKQMAMAGKLPILHGHEWYGGFAPPVNPARGLFMKAKESALVGHHHRTSEHTEKTLGGKVVACHSTGCLCGLEPEYAPYNNYNHGFAFVEVGKDGDYEVENIKIINYKIV
jgi:predicted phosphodiesterase